MSLLAPLDALDASPVSLPPASPLPTSLPLDPAAPTSGSPATPSRTRPRWRRERRLAAAVRRGLEIGVALPLVVATLPPVAVGWGLTALGQPVLVRRSVLGFRCRTMSIWRVNPAGPRIGRWLGWLGLAWGVAAWSVLRGRLAWVGPRAVGPDEPNETLSDAAARPRFRVPPGVLSLAEVRRRANIDYGGELAADLDYVSNRSLQGDLGIIARWIWLRLLGDRGGLIPERLELFGLSLWNVSLDRAVAEIVRLARGTEPRQICFVNADCVNLAQSRPDYRRLLAEAHENLADGIGMKLAAQAAGCSLRQNLCGTDLFPALCHALEGSEVGLFLLGARPGVAEAVAAWVAEHYPGTPVRGWHHGYFTPAEEPAVLAEIRASGAEILLVAFGAPRQDLWIHQHLARTGVRVALGVGGLFDFYSGRIPRAPLWVRELCLEWAYRLYQEPRRMWRRYLGGNIRFLIRLAWLRCRGRLGGPLAEAATVESPVG